MKTTIFALAVVITLAGCAAPVFLQPSPKGPLAICIPWPGWSRSAQGWTRTSIGPQEIQRECIKNYQRQGYQRTAVPAVRDFPRCVKGDPSSLRCS